MRFQSYFNTAIKIIQLYDASMPLSHFLKQYFSQHKKHGSKDRKIIAHICYNFYRLGKSFTKISTEEKLKIAIFICNDVIDEWLFLYDEEWLQHQSIFLEQRITFLQKKYACFLNDVFPFANEASNTLDISAFTRSFFIQPDVFLRIRPGCTEKVISKLKEHEISFKSIDEDCIALPSSISINSIINIDEEVVIQDYSSQRVKAFLNIIQSQLQNSESQINVWDCCAGSGGKSILAYDTFKEINITVSDVRTSIIQNLKQRFAAAGIKKYKSFIADITKASFQIQNSNFNIVICDAPCTGSGTWSRTPEQLYSFSNEKLNEYVLLQKKIISNTVSLLNSNGLFLYITCSVFKKENEENVDYIKNQFHLELIKMELLKGYQSKADTMFAALFKKK
ncbi:MAG: methyltransferase domain-containing protein [Parafilimonas sp.]